jgi:hypothetical protein
MGGIFLKKIIFALVLLLLVNPAFAEEKSKTGADPTDFITRYEPSYEHLRSDGGGHSDLFVMRGDLAIRRDLSLRLDVPLIYYNPPERIEPAGYESSFGTGDLVSQIMYKPYSSGNLAAVMGLRIDWPTNSKAELGRGGIMYAPVAGVAWFPMKGVGIIPFFQYNLSGYLTNDPLPGDRNMNQLSYRQIVLWQPMHKYISWLTIDPEIIFDFEDEDTTTLDLGIEYGKMVSKTIGIFVKPTIGLTDGSKDWGIKVGFRHMFPSAVLLGKEKQ